MVMNWDDAQSVAGKLAGVMGALVSMRFLKGPVVSRLVMAAGGALFSWYAAEYVSSRTSLPEGLAGFLLGLFGMSILSRIWDWIQTTSITDILLAFIKIPSSKKENNDGKNP
jgi:hypothetical protein